MKVLVADKLSKEGIALLKKEGYDVVEGWDMDKAKVPEVLKDCDAVIVRSATKIRKDYIDIAPKLKAIGRAGVGLDNVDAEYAKTKGIAVRNTPDATTISVAELTMTHMLAAHRDVVTGTVTTKAGKWEKKSLQGYELYGKTLGFIGIGRIGHAVAKRAQAFGMNVIAFDAYAKSPEVKNVSLDEVLAKSDVITIHCPLTPETKHLVNAVAFGKMKKGVVVMNISRGGIIDENALYDAMKSGHVRAACLDVFETEPATAHKLFELPNLFLTPHIGGETHEGQTRAGVQVAEAVIEELRKRK